MWVCLALLELACGFAPQFPDQIFADGAEAMHISYDRPSVSSWLLFSEYNNASFITSSAYLMDGKIAIPTRVQWDTGTQTTTSHVSLVGSPSGFDVADGDLAVLAVYFPKTPYAVPAGVSMSLILEDSGTTETLANLTATVVQLNNGATGVIFVAQNAYGHTLHVDLVTITLRNNLAGATWIASGAPFDISEVWFGNLHEFKISSDPKITLMGGPTERRSHSNQPWPLTQGRPYRQLQTALVPFGDSTAYSGANNFEQVRYALASAKSALVIPRLYQRGTTTVDSDTLNQLTIFGRPSVNAFGAMTGLKDASGMWTASLVIEEAPP